MRDQDASAAGNFNGVKVGRWIAPDASGTIVWAFSTLADNKYETLLAT